MQQMLPNTKGEFRGSNGTTLPLGPHLQDSYSYTTNRVPHNPPSQVGPRWCPRIDGVDGRDDVLPLYCLFLETGESNYLPG